MIKSHLYKIIYFTQGNKNISKFQTSRTHLGKFQATNI